MEEELYFIVQGRHRPEKLEAARGMRSKMTEEEALLWARLRRNQLNGLHFRRQQVIEGYIVDFFCLAVTLVIECDGDQHLDAVEYDRERDAALARLGLFVLRIPNHRIRSDVEGVLAEIAAIAASPIKNRWSSST